MPAHQNYSGPDRELSVLTEVAKALTVPLDLPALLKTAMDKIAEMLDPAEFGLVFIWDASEGVFRPQAACGLGIQDLPALYQMRLGPGESITGKVHNNGQAVFLGTEQEIATEQRTMHPANREKMLLAFAFALPKTLVAAPLVAGEQRYGVLYLGTVSGPAFFAESDMAFVQTLADLIALAIDRARLESEAADIQYAKQADQLRAEALATLSHELRTPLAAIKDYSSALLLDEIDWPEDKQREFLRLIEEECDNLQTMITDILDSSLIDVGQMILTFEPVRLERLAQEVVDETSHRTGNHHLVIDFPPGFPIVDADPLRIKQVMRNIVDNAVKYSPAGGLVVIRGFVRPRDVVISISDQGVGISPEDLIPLFEKYFRVKDPTGYHVPGTGLGLPVARAIVESHRGRIWAESKVGEGTTLYFSVPLALPNPEGV